MDEGTVQRTVAGTPQGGVISPLLSNIYLHALDTLWLRHSAPLGTLVRYCDDFVVMCRTRKDCEQAEVRIRVILKRLGLELHPDKTRRIELSFGKEGFDFLGCHAQAPERANLGAAAQAAVLPASLAESARHGAGPTARARVDPQVSMSCGPPHGHCGPQPRAAGLGELLSHR